MEKVNYFDRDFDWEDYVRDIVPTMAHLLPSVAIPSAVVQIQENAVSIESERQEFLGHISTSSSLNSPQEDNQTVECQEDENTNTLTEEDIATDIIMMRDKKKEKELRKQAWKLKKKEEKLRLKAEKSQYVKNTSLSSSSQQQVVVGEEAKQWDTFFSSHVTGSIYKPRRYIYHEFKKVFDQLFPRISFVDKKGTSGEQGEGEGDGEEQQPQHSNMVVHMLEVGCGYGCTMYPILEELIPVDTSSQHENTIHGANESNESSLNSSPSNGERQQGQTTTTTTEATRSIHYHATDYAYTALQILQQNPLFTRFASHITTDLWDVTQPYLYTASVDIVLAIFALSAVKPEYHRQSMEHIYSLLVKENGNGNESKDKHENQNKSKFLLFRDYGLHDLTMYRHQYRYNEFTFGRQDGTICYYFSIEYFTRLAESVGFVVRECEYATVINHNRKTNQALYRVFLHAVLEVKIL